MRAKRRGFTLVELLVVVTIIGILLAFILKAYLGSIQAAERAATISLIAKLEAALTDRVDALNSQHPVPTWSHNWLAGIWVTGGTTAPDMPSNERAQVIAQYDYLRAELPDVFVIEPRDPNYKVNFGALGFNPLAGTLVGTYRDFTLPLGGGWANPADPTDIPAVTGIKGASFAAAAAIYKQLGFVQKGMDGADNDGDTMIDEWDEGTSGLSATQTTEMLVKLAKHTHKTARAEMLYAILVEGTGPLGSLCNKDDFTPQEVRDTDGDGLLEFVDAWGEPLQFYRWPIMHRSDTQKGFPDLAKIVQDTAAGARIGPYSTVYEQREQNPLDPSQSLLAPSWWGTFNSKYPWGSPRATFGAMFHSLVDPLAVTAGATGFAPNNPTINTYWDRSSSASPGYYPRRAYYSRFLVVSGGSDKQPGVAQLGVNYKAIDERSSFPLPTGGFGSARDTTGGPVAISIANLIMIENQAGKIDPNRNAAGCPVLTSGRNDTNTLLEEFANDDITTQNLQASGGPLRSNP